MKVELTLNIRKEDEPKFIIWFRLFALQILLAEDETFIDAKIDGEDFKDLYKGHDALH